MSFDETAVRRDTTGRFAEKTGASPEVSLKPGEIDRGDGVICNPKASWAIAHCAGCGWMKETSSPAEAEAEAEAHRADPGYEEVSIKEGRGGMYTQYTFLKDGVPHRVGAPAVWLLRQPLGDGDYYENGLRHRVDGPAVFRGDYSEMNEWWVRGERIEMPVAESQDIWEDLGSAFTQKGVSFEDDPYGEKHRDALAYMQRMVMEKVLNERVRLRAESA